MRWRVQPIKRRDSPIELMLALSLGSLLFALILWLIGADLLGQPVAQHWREQVGSAALS